MADDYLDMYSTSMNINMPLSAFQALQALLMALARVESADLCDFIFRSLEHISSETTRMQVANDVCREIMRLFVVVNKVDLGDSTSVNLMFDPNLCTCQNDDAQNDVEIDDSVYIQFLKSLGFDIEEEMGERENEDDKKDRDDLDLGEPDPDTWFS
jgi:hypothetical protein